MDPTTLLGIILGFALIVNGIGFDKIGNFIDIPSMVIVIGGALAATLSSYPLGILKDIPKHFAVLIRGNRYNVPKLIEQLVDLGTIARQSGLLALEDKAEEIKDPFFKQSVLMIVDANDPDKVRLVLERELDNMMVRHDQAAGLYEKAASYAPSFGMIGTLIGLINMLKGMNMVAYTGLSLPIVIDLLLSRELSEEEVKEHIISTHQIAVNPIEVKLAEDDEDIEDL